MIDTTMIIGIRTEYNQYRVDDLKEGYSPFIEEFSSFKSFVNWSKDVKRPLLKDRYLAVISEELDMSRLESRVATLRQMKNKYIKLVMLIKPRERLYNLEFQDVHVINLSLTSKVDFETTLKRELDPITEGGIKEIIKRIGLSYQTYSLYKKELLELKQRDEDSIAEIITEKKLRPTEIILLGVLNRKKKMIKEHYLLCNKYSEQWVMNHYRSTLGLVLWLKLKVQEGEMTLMDIRLSDKFSRMLPLVRDSRIGDVFMLKSMINGKKAPIERYTLQPSTGVMLKHETEKLNDMSSFKLNL